MEEVGTGLIREETDLIIVVEEPWPFLSALTSLSGETRGP
jgi:hypothetical protein